MRGVSEIWTQVAQRAGITLSSEQIQRLSRYIDLLLEANQRMNLTRITDRAAAQVQHVGDALTLLPFLPRETHRLADVGSGGGVPGIPIAIARPDVTVVLIESTKKKAAFLEETAKQLELGNVTVSALRAEDAGAKGSPLRESFDVVAARAVATMDWLAEWCLPLARKAGKVLAMKGPRVNEELPEARRAIKLLGGGGPVVHAVDLPGAEHHVVVEIPKMARTDAKYPRAATRAKGKPI
jgi:16S rRNA (guanine527-N7)-methyltransferase